MKPLNELTLPEYLREKNSGMLWEHYPTATGIYYRDCLQKGGQKMPEKPTERYGTRTLCGILSNMRKLHETHNYSYLPGLIEEAQYRAERMENALEVYGNEWGGLTTMEEQRTKLKKEIKQLTKERDNLKDEIPSKEG
jgi:hypothetical protein